MEQWPAGGSDALLERLQRDYIPDLGHVDIEGLLRDSALGRMAIVSSFGAESAALLHFVTRILPEIPVLFLETGKHFPQTLAYVETLSAHLGLNLRKLRPQAQMLSEDDPDGQLHARDPNACCTIRKTFPLQDALDGYDSWISGRKRYQGAERAALPLIERDGTLIKVNPFALWQAADIADYMQAHDLPVHPLRDMGYPSIGCACCTKAVKPGEDARAGRWAHMPEKTECGIHLGPDGRFRRS